MVTKMLREARGRRAANTAEFKQRIAIVQWAFYSRAQRKGPRTTRELQDDAHAATDIAWNQCFGDVDKARQFLADMAEAAGGSLSALTLHERYLQYIHWLDCGSPARPRAMTKRQRAALREMIAANAACVLNDAANAKAVFA